MESQGAPLRPFNALDGVVDGVISRYRYLWMRRFPLVDAAVGELKVHFIAVQEEKHLHSWLSRLLHPFLPAFAFQFGPSLSGSVTNTFYSGCASFDVSERARLPRRRISWCTSASHHH
jgi:hypothetical protein